MHAVVTGQMLDTIDVQLREHFNAGDRVELLVGIDADLTSEQLAQFTSHLRARGMQLTSPVQIGSTEKWPNALRITFRRPSYEGVGFLPIPVLLFGGLALFGASVIGWKFTSEVAQGIRENIVPIVGSLVVGGVLVYYLSRRVPQA